MSLQLGTGGSYEIKHQGGKWQDLGTDSLARTNKEIWASVPSPLLKEQSYSDSLPGISSYPGCVCIGT